MQGGENTGEAEASEEDVSEEYLSEGHATAYGATFPDIPGCFAAADDVESLPQAAQQAVEAHFGIDEDIIPSASALDKWADHPDYQSGGFWMLVEIDLSRESWRL